MRPPLPRRQHSVLYDQSVSDLWEDGGIPVTVVRLTSGDDNGVTELAALREPRQRLSPESKIARIPIRDVTATLAYRLNSCEHARRRAVGLLAWTGLEELDALLGLPEGLPVSTSELDDSDRQLIHRLPPGCVHLADGVVIRHIVRPLCVDLAVVTPEGQDFRAGLRKAGQFGTYCTRLLATTGTPDSLPELRVEAVECGVGLVINAATIPEMVVVPKRFTSTAHTAAGWRFAEQVYREIVRRDLI